MAGGPRDDYTAYRFTRDSKSSNRGAYGTEVRPLLDAPVNAGAAFEGADPDGVWESHIDFFWTFTFARRQPLTVEAWVRSDAAADDDAARRIASKEDPEGGWLLGARSGRLVFSRFAAAGRFAPYHPTGATGPPVEQAAGADTVSAPLAAGWHHVMATYDRTVMRLVIDGRTVAAATSTLLLPWVDSRFTVGATARGWREWAGGLDEIAVYGRALGAEEAAGHRAALER